MPKRRLRKPRGHVGRPPAGRHEPDAQLVRTMNARASASRASAAYTSTFAHSGLKLRSGRTCAVDARLVVVFFVEGAEQTIPDDQDAAVVAVEVAVVHRVMHTVVRWRAEPAVEPAELADLLRVHPELVEQIDQRDRAEHQRRHADDAPSAGRRSNPAARRSRFGAARSTGCSPRSGGAPRARPRRRPPDDQRGAASSSRGRTSATRQTHTAIESTGRRNSATCSYAAV